MRRVPLLSGQYDSLVSYTGPRRGRSKAALWALSAAVLAARVAAVPGGGLSSSQTSVLASPRLTRSNSSAMSGSLAASGNLDEELADEERKAEPLSAMEPFPLLREDCSFPFCALPLPLLRVAAGSSAHDSSTNQPWSGCCRLSETRGVRTSLSSAAFDGALVSSSI